MIKSILRHTLLIAFIGSISTLALGNNCQLQNHDLLGYQNYLNCYHQEAETKFDSLFENTLSLIANQHFSLQNRNNAYRTYNGIQTNNEVKAKESEIETPTLNTLNSREQLKEKQAKTQNKKNNWLYY